VCTVYGTYLAFETARRCAFADYGISRQISHMILFLSPARQHSRKEVTRKLWLLPGDRMQEPVEAVEVTFTAHHPSIFAGFVLASTSDVCFCLVAHTHLLRTGAVS